MCFPFALWETLKGLCYELESLPWWPALTDSSYRGLFMAGAREGIEEFVCMSEENRDSLCVCWCIFTCKNACVRGFTWCVCLVCVILSWVHFSCRCLAVMFISLTQTNKPGQSQSKTGNQWQAFYGSASLFVYPLCFLWTPSTQKPTLIYMN